MPSALVIVNPASANGATRERWPAIEQQLRARWSAADFSVAHTGAPNHATELAAAAEGYATVVSVGGDGTLNEVVNGLMRHDAAVRPALALVQSGTGSDFARTLGFGLETDTAIARLNRAQPQAIDVGETAYMVGRQLLTRYFVNIAGLGFDAEVSAAVSREAGRGRKGRAVYLLSVFKTVLGLRSKRLRITTSLASGAPSSRECGAVMVTICNGRYFGGGMHVAPDAVLHDGEFDVVVFGAMSPLEFVINFPRVYRGTHLAHPKVSVTRASNVRIEQLGSTENLLSLQAEGELLGAAPASFRLLPGALNVLV